MRIWNKVWLFAVCVSSLICVSASVATAQEPGWYPRVIARDYERTWIEATPIEQRPYRPFHFYGNTIRRTYYRGTPIVLPRDVVQTTRYAIVAIRPGGFGLRR